MKNLISLLLVFALSADALATTSSRAIVTDASSGLTAGVSSIGEHVDTSGNGLATSTLQSSEISALGSPFQAGGSIGNTAFGISGTLPSFASTPTFNLGTLNGAAMASNQATQITAETAIQSSVANIPVQGQAAATASTPVTMPAALQVMGGTFSALNTDLLTGTVSGWYDAKGWASASVNVITTTTITAGAVTFEQTDDTTNAAAGNVMQVTDATTITPTFVSAYTLVASTTKKYIFPITSRYIRIRISTAVTGTGTLQASATLRQVPYATLVQEVVISGTVATTVSSGAITATLAAQAIFTDIASGAKTTTATVFVTPTNSASNSFVLAVTAASGTTPTLDLSVGESFDSGATCTPLYQYERVTAVLAQPLMSPMLRMGGNRLCYTYTIGGTTPSFTMAVTRIASSLQGAIIRRYFDRTINPNSAGSSTAQFYAEDCTNATAFTVVTSAGTINPVMTLESSEDGVSYAPTSFTLTATTTGAVVTPVTGVLAKYFKLFTTTAGTGSTVSYIAFRCRGD